MKPVDITRSQWSVLSALSRGGNDGMMQVDLARLLDVGKVTVGGLVDRLEATGHVERRPDAHDRRAKRVFITEQGFAMLSKMIVVAAKYNNLILQDVSPEDLEVTERTLFKVKENIKAAIKIAAAEGAPETDTGSEAPVTDAPGMDGPGESLPPRRPLRRAG